MDNVEASAREVMEKFAVPGLAVLVAWGEGAVQSRFWGTDADGVKVDAESLFIVASLTKLATALCVLRLVDDGKLALDDLLGKYAQDAAAAQPEVTIRNLMCHTAGLPRDLPNGSEIYGKNMTWTQIAAECLRVPLEMPPRTRVTYGNVGYGLLAIVVERVTKQPFVTVLHEQVLEPLGIEGYLCEPPRTPVKLAGVRSRHVGTEIEPFNSAYYRSLGFPWAGLITTPAGALKLVRAFAEMPKGYLSEALAREATSNQTDDLPGGSGGPFDAPHAAWGLGVDIRGEKKVHWTPENASPRTFGHAGASGCVAWYDPDKKIAWAILGTRTADYGWLVRGATKIAEGLLEPNG